MAKLEAPVVLPSVFLSAKESDGDRDICERSQCVKKLPLGKIFIETQQCYLKLTFLRLFIVLISF